MNGSRFPRSVAALIVAVVGWSWLHSQLAAEAPRTPPSSQTKTKAAGPKIDVGTKTISGRVFDRHGKPLADTRVWLIRRDESNFTLPEPTVVAETQTRTDGRFAVAAVVPQVGKDKDDPWDRFEIWFWKRGFVVGRRGFYGWPIEHPIHLLLEDDSPFVLQLKTPKGTPCSGATVTPNFADFDYSRSIPKPLQSQLTAKSTTGGHVEIRGFNGRLKGISIEKPELGNQTLLLSDQASSPLVVTLHNTRTLEGQFTFPKGKRVDTSKVIVHLRVTSNRRAGCENQGKDDGESSLFGFWQEFSPKVDSDGRFGISGVLDHGTDRVHVEGFADIPYLFSPPDRSKAPKPDLENGVVKIEIPLTRGIWCNVLIRDAQTKKPLPGVDFTIGPKRVVDGQFDCDETIALPDSERTDSQGRIRVRVRPGETYRVRCTPSEGYLDWSANESAIQIPGGVDRFDLPPIELIPACAIKGRVVDPVGKPLPSVSVVSVSNAGTQREKRTTGTHAYKTTTDSAGVFELEDLAVGADVTLVPVGAGAPCGDSVKIVAGQGKAVDLKTCNEELVALSGRVLGFDYKPVSRAQLVIENDEVPDAPDLLSVVTGDDGRFHTPVRFPKRLKYRVVARSLLDIVGSSVWMCPAVSGTRFPDLAIDRSKLRIGTPLTGDEVVARVNGEPIRARELLERASVERQKGGQTLFDASKDLLAGKITESEFRSLQDEAIDKYAAALTRTRLAAQALLAMLDAEGRKAAEDAVAKDFAFQIEKFKKDFQVKTADEVDEGLQQQGTSLASVRAAWRYSLLANDYFRSYSSDRDALAAKALQYYKAHADRYVTPEKVGWQLIEARFHKPRPGTFSTNTTQTDTDSGQSQSSVTDASDFPLISSAFEKATKLETPPDHAQSKPSPFLPEESVAKSQTHGSSSEEGEYVGRTKAREILENALERLRKGEPFEAVAKTVSDGPGAEQGGWQMVTRANNIADMKTANALRQLAEGETSSIIETDQSMRIVRVVSRIPASRTPFEDVDESIQSRLRNELQKKRWNALLARSSIELPFSLPRDLSAWDGVEDAP